MGKGDENEGIGEKGQTWEKLQHKTGQSTVFWVRIFENCLRPSQKI